MSPFSAFFKDAPLFFLAFARVLALILTTPLLSTKAVSRVVRVALAGLVAFLVMPNTYPAGVVNISLLSVFNLHYILLLIGEVLLGILTGFFVSLTFSIFGTAGQFFSYQMGFGASQVYDTLAKVQNPLMGQYFNFVAVLVFLQTKGFQKLFLGGVLRSFQAINCFIFINEQEVISGFFLHALGKLFAQALVISMPIIATLFLINVTMGMFSKAAPQMNLLSEGFPITILTTFFILSVALPLMIDLFMSMLDASFREFEALLIQMGQKI